MLEEERAFFQFLEGQLEMVDAFYKGSFHYRPCRSHGTSPTRENHANVHIVYCSSAAKELESVTKLKVLKQQLYVADEWKRRQDIRKVR